VNLPNGASARFVEVNPRLGIQLPLAQGPVLRVVGQQWRRPGSAGTLAPIDTLGIVLNDRLPMAGGLYQRARVQLDAETSAATFLQAFADAERVDNGLGGARNTISVFEVTQLQTLHNRQDAFSPQADLENTPVFGRGVVHSLGLAANHRWNPDQTVGVRYLYRDSRQGGDRAGLAVPYHPRHMLRLGSHWVLSDRWLLGATATYRGLRFRDDANLDPIRAGWAAGLTLAWESEDKRASVQAILDNLLSRTRAGDLSGAQLTVRLGYRF
jgi:hypothetical protein